MKFRGAMFAACLLEEAKEHKGAVKKEGDNDDRLVGCTVVGPGRKKISFAKLLDMAKMLCASKEGRRGLHAKTFFVVSS